MTSHPDLGRWEASSAFLICLCFFIPPFSERPKIDL
uniref:Uncharacterized protein n=1 Tax=Anguilla anguilla TaxID=7936 RepID=A0A0E9TRF1_ANGAN